MSEEKKQPRKAIESGVPDPMKFMHPVMKANFGNWDWHDRLRPGVLHHVSKTGDEIWTVRAGTQRQMDVYTIRKRHFQYDAFRGFDEMHRTVQACRPASLAHQLTESCIQFQ